MQAYHDGQRMAEVLGLSTEFSFASNFVDGVSGSVDPIAIAARVPRVRRTSPSIPLSSSHFAEADYCIALRIWDVLLWFAIMRRPRRDVGICSDFAHTLAECSIQLLPRSIFPYDLVPMTRLDHIDKEQVKFGAPAPVSVPWTHHSFLWCRYSWIRSTAAKSMAGAYSAPA